MKIRDILAEADPSELGPMNPKMKDLLGKVHQGDVKQAQADADAKAKADAEKATQNKAEQEKIIAFAKKHDYDLEPQDIGYFKKGVEDGKRGSVDRGAGEAYGPHFGAYYRGTQIGYKMKEQGEGLEEGGFFDPDKPNIGDMVKHRNGAVGKVKKIGTQGDETHVYFRDQNGEMNYGQWKKHVFPMEESVSEDSNPRETLEMILQKLEREIEWPLTDIMDASQVRKLLSPLVRAVNDKMLSMEEDVTEAHTTAIAITNDDFKRYAEGPYETKIKKIFKDYIQRGVEMTKEGDKIVFDGDPKLMRRMEKALKYYDDNPTFATENVSGAFATSMGNGNGFANGGPGTIKRAGSTRKRKKKSK